MIVIAVPRPRSGMNKLLDFLRRDFPALYRRVHPAESTAELTGRDSTGVKIRCWKNWSDPDDPAIVDARFSMRSIICPRYRTTKSG
jgi:hypothetical protein